MIILWKIFSIMAECRDIFGPRLSAFRTSIFYLAVKETFRRLKDLAAVPCMSGGHKGACITRRTTTTLPLFYAILRTGCGRCDKPISVIMPKRRNSSRRRLIRPARTATYSSRKPRRSTCRWLRLISIRRMDRYRA